MTYLVLARKWRPRSFDTLVGQDHVVRALTHALSTQRLHHAWLFTGTRGVGKTTLSRILAKSLNCEQGITPTPCGVCRACTEIDAGRYVDYVELDAASNRGVDEMTQLLEQAVYAPSVGRIKVYMIDEVHMLTGHAFNAMLKTLEEPPPHVKFILATTDPQKIPVTVLSRCLQFNLKQMTAGAIVGHLQDILGQETIPFEVPALRLLAQAAAGSMRDALSLTDQAIAYSAGHLTAEAVQGMLGTIDQRHLADLLQALSAGDAQAVLRVADDLAARGLSYSGALADLAVLLSRIAIVQRVPAALADDDPARESLQALASLLHPDLVQLFYSVAVHSRQELSLAPDEYAGFVMACLRMLALAPPGSVPPNPPGLAGSGSAPSAGGSAGTPEGAGAVSASATAAASAAAGSPAPVAPAAPPAAAPVSAAAASATPVSAAPAAVASAPAPASSATGASAASVPLPAWEDDAAPAVAASPEPAPARTPAAAPPPARPQAPATAAPSAPPASSPAVAPAAARPALSEQTRPAAMPDGPAKAPSAAPARPVAEASAGPAGHDDGPPPFDDGPPVYDDVPYDEAEPPGWVGAEADEETGWAPMPDDAAALGEVAAALAPVAPARGGKGRGSRAAPGPQRLQPADWAALAAKLPVSGAAGELARQSEWLGVEGNTIQLRVGIPSLAQPAARRRLCTVLTEHFGQVVELDITYGATGDTTAHAVAQANRARLQARAEQAVTEDALVQAMAEVFGAVVVPGSVRPLTLN